MNTHPNKELPAIEVDTRVGDSTLPEGLTEMTRRYEFSQLPGRCDVNVRIAGHRDVHSQMSDGNYAYLLYKGTSYRYVYADMRVVKPDNWEVITPPGFSCLTRTVCAPIAHIANDKRASLDYDCRT